MHSELFSLAFSRVELNSPLTRRRPVRPLVPDTNVASCRSDDRVMVRPSRPEKGPSERAPASLHRTIRSDDEETDRLPRCDGPLQARQPGRVRLRSRRPADAAVPAYTP